MAGQYARVKRSIVADDDFRTLTLEAKVVYLYVLFQPKLSPCGALDYMPSRIARQADLTLDQVDTAMAELVDRKYVLRDEDTDEIAIRTYVRHDLTGANANSVKAVYNALDQLVSVPLRTAIEANLPPVMPPDPRSFGHRANGVRTSSEHRADEVRTTPAHSPQPKPAAAAPGVHTSDADSDPPPDPAAAAAAAIEQLADRELDRRIVDGAKVRNRTTYRIPILEDMRAAHLDAAEALAYEHPDWTPDQLAGELAPPEPDPRPSWTPDPDCPTCHGQPWIEGPDETMARCPRCYPPELGDPILPTTNHDHEELPTP